MPANNRQRRLGFPILETVYAKLPFGIKFHAWVKIPTPAYPPPNYHLGKTKTMAVIKKSDSEKQMQCKSAIFDSHPSIDQHNQRTSPHRTYPST
ncbi:hypothetical protein BCON_0061g00400 [Botryotinia convoluta]|uniref:Uncharacterized protein n=1 Tax=Botryotinia convoluta TaxID=54673 RepID=A0A4Z1I9D3_9HELO|nr:hypothetical protein BCON_0061g00400 [Botryotinia convoluta]